MSKNTVRLHIVLRIFLVIAILVLLVLSIYHSYTSNTINDDTGWAIANGWHLLSQGFHYSLSNSWVVKHPYLSTGPEWMSDALFYWLYLHFGWGGLVGIMQLSIISVWGLAIVRSVKSRSIFTLLLSAILVDTGMAVFLVDRPQVFSYFFLVLYMWWRTYRYASTSLTQRLGWRQLIQGDALWVLLMPIWASLHGGFALFYPLFLLDSLAHRKWKSLWLVPVTAIEIVLLMPNHLYNLLYPFLWQSVPYDKYISEVLPIPFSGGYMLVILAILVATLAEWKYVSKMDKIMLVLLDFFALHSFRNLPYATLFLLWHMDKVDVRIFFPRFFTLTKQFYEWDTSTFRPKWTIALFSFAAVVTLGFPIANNHVHAFQDKRVVDNAAILYLVNHASVLHFLGFEPMQYSDELTLLGHPNYLESQQDVWAGIISPKTEPNLTMATIKLESGQIPLTNAWGYKQMRYILVRNGSIMDNELKLIPKTWVPMWKDKYATVYVRKGYVKSLNSEHSMGRLNQIPY